MDRINSMNLDELFEFEKMTRNTGRVIGALGIGICLLAFIFANIALIVCGCIVIYFLGHMSVGIDATRVVMQERIIKLGKEKGLIK